MGLRIQMRKNQKTDYICEFVPADPLMMSSRCSTHQGTVPLIVTWMLLSIAIITVCIRIYVRLHVRRNIGWDDYTAVASLVS